MKLQEKLNNYLSFALDGQLQRLYPASSGKRVAIQIDSYQRPDEQTLSLIDVVREKIRKAGLAFYVNIVPDQTLQG